MTPNIVLFDIDNTLANMDHRLHYLDRGHVDWVEFENEAIYDQPIVETIKMAQACNALGLQVWCWSGRSERIRKVTEVWLKTNAVPYQQLLLTPVDNKTPMPLVKLRWLDNAPVPRDRVICAYDDDPNVVNVLRERGKLLVYRVVRPTGYGEE